MMKFRAIILTSCLVMNFGVANLAQAETWYLAGGELFKKCNSTIDQDISYCKVYLIGVLDGRVTYMGERSEIDGKSPPLGICLYGRKGITVDDLRRAVIRKIDSDHQRYDGASGGEAVVDAIKASFPCGTGNNSGSLIFKK